MAISEWTMADLVREVCFDVGDGPLLLGGALPGYRRFADALGAGARFPYMIVGVDDPAVWEAGSGTLDSEGRLVREPLASSAGGDAVDFAPGEKRIGLVLHSGWIAAVEGHGHGLDEIAGLAAALADRQPASAGLDLLAGLTTTGFGRALLELGDGAAMRAHIGAGTSNAEGSVTRVDAAGGTTGLGFAGGPVTGSGTLTLEGTLAIGHGGTGATSTGAARTALGLGDGATRNVGTGAGSLAAGDDARLTGAVQRGGDAMTGALTLNGPPAADLHAATKAYVDGQIQAIDGKASVRLATTANIALTGNQVIDGVTTASGDRILVKDQSVAADNGLYLAASGAWTRAADMDGWAKIPNAHVWVESGSANADRAWVCTANAGGTLGSSAISWVQAAGPGAYQAVSANLGAIAGLASIADRLPYFTGSGTAGMATFTGFGRSLVDDADAASGRATLGLGTIATQSAASVAISGGTAVLSALEVSRVGGAATLSTRISTDAGYTNGLQLQTGALARWSVNKSGSAESGSSAGSDFEIRRYDDSGTYVSTPLRIGRADGVTAIDGGLRPLGDNGQPLGAGAYRWSVVYAASGAINTSDARAKCDVGAISDALLDAWGDVAWQRFRFVEACAAKGDAARWHVGLVAQQLGAAIDARMGAGSAVRLGLLCHDSWAAEPAQCDGEGREVRAARPAGDRWGVRYEECLALEAAWQRRRIDRIEAALAALQGGTHAGG
ncbi:tail fiber domain-containing protein [Sphingobium sp. AP49]|uniref:tail fiber domain-containing protein n=1 Tax=Sphingobium sp. AP49 TaxID=1144307 RepID=UPI00026EDDAD|nr:tail fiber domain-containing protein [Sphingobium sp. AP49]WHO40498.1 tail fiber domain-containing protein [Sphingobium sp. AP49]